MKKLLFLFVLPLYLMSYDFIQNAQLQKFMIEMEQKHGFSQKYLESIFTRAKFQPKILKRYQGAKKKYKTDATWTKYSQHIVVPYMFHRAKKFKHANYALLSKIANAYQVPINLIVAFAGVESSFGKSFGNYSIFDALTTLAFFENRKTAFFRHELEEYLLFCREKRSSVFTFKGSFAGAMGWVQQLPSINRKYGVDYNRDGVSDPWDKADALATIANFLHQNGWDNRGIVAIPAKYPKKKFRAIYTHWNVQYSLGKIKSLGIEFGSFPQNQATLIVLFGKENDEIWLGAKNFDILTHYNNSVNYGMALYKISTSF